MNQKIKDGIVIDNTIYMMDGKHTGFPALMRVFQLFFIMLGSYGVISIFIECFSLPVTASHIQLALFFSSTLFFFLLTYPSYDLIKLAIVATAFLFIIKVWFEQLQNGFYILENAILDQVESYYNIPVIMYRAQYSTAEKDVTLLVIMFLIPLVGLLSYSMIRTRLLNLTNLILLIPVAASFAFGITPSEEFLLAYILTILFLSRSYGMGRPSSYKEQKFMVHRINSRAALMLSLATLVLFLTMKLLVSEEKYEETTKINEVKLELQDFIMNFSLEDVSDRIRDIKWLPKQSSIGTGGLNSGKLGRVDQVNYNESEQLILSVPLKSISEGIYLKGYVGSNYTGDSWEGHSGDVRKKYEKLLTSITVDKFQPVNGVVTFLEQINSLNNTIPRFLLQKQNSVNKSKYEFTKGKISIKYKDANKNYIYAPYLTDFNASDAARYENDLYAAPVSKENEYEFNYYYNLNMNEELSEFLGPIQESMEEYAKYEKLYRRFVYDTYTQLPKDGLDRLKEDFSKEKIGVRVDNIQKAVSYIKDYLHNNTRYTLSPGKLPKNKDFVEYFIYENKVGYCSHYASAGVLMLRAMGYPARYVEGYAVTSTDILYSEPLKDQKINIYSDQMNYEEYDTQVQVSVKDYCAHAWVEIYIDGCGWFPVEFTPSAGLNNTEEIIGDVAGIGEEITRENETRVTPTPKPTETIQEPEEKPDTPQITEPAKEDGKNSENQPQLPLETGTKMDRFDGFLILMVIALFIIIILIPLLWVIYRRKVARSTDNRNKRAILLYREIERLLISIRALPKKSRSLEDHLDYVRENCPFIDEVNFDSVIETVRKARFGRNTISRRELAQVENYYQELCGRTFRAISPFKRTMLKIIIFMTS